MEASERTRHHQVPTVTLVDIIEQSEPPLEDGVVLPLDEETEMQEHFGIFTQGP